VLQQQMAAAVQVPKHMLFPSVPTTSVKPSGVHPGVLTGRRAGLEPHSISALAAMMAPPRTPKRNALKDPSAASWRDLIKRELYGQAYGKKDGVGTGGCVHGTYQEEEGTLTLATTEDFHPGDYVHLWDENRNDMGTHPVLAVDHAHPSGNSQLQIRPQHHGLPRKIVALKITQNHMFNGGMPLNTPPKKRPKQRRRGGSKNNRRANSSPSKRKYRARKKAANTITGAMGGHIKDMLGRESFTRQLMPPLIQGGSADILLGDDHLVDAMAIGSLMMTHDGKTVPTNEVVPVGTLMAYDAETGIADIKLNHPLVHIGIDLKKE